MSKYKHITKDNAKLTPYEPDIAKHLIDDEMIAIYLNQVLEDGDEAELKRAFGYIAEAKGIDTTRDSLYKSLNEQTKLQFDTVCKLIKSLGLTIKAVKA
ncbi:MAG: putative addiction module antidote protein [Campylobacteraceae bacterium]|jgi:probable addiction module antidote protein|nr:putative addiction module antidote protein [Campylobacteraceae bacterium]